MDDWDSVSKPAPAAKDGDWASVSSPPSRGVLGTIKDVGITALKSAIAVPELGVGLADLVTGGQAGKLAEDLGVRFKDAKDILDQAKTPAQQEADARVQQADGFWSTMEQIGRNPSVVPHAVLENLPSMIVGGAGVGAGLTKVLPKLAPVVAGGVGEGVVTAGQNAEQLRQQTKDGLLTGDQSLLMAGSGLLTGAIGVGAGKLAQKLGIADIDTILASGTTAQKTAALKPKIKQITGGVISEGVLEELPQSAQEQIAQNIALGEPWDKGVGNAAAMGMTVGAAMGAGANLLPQSGAPGPVIPPDTPLKDDLIAAGKAMLAGKRVAPPTTETLPPVNPRVSPKEGDTLQPEHAALRALAAGGMSSLTPDQQRVLVDAGAAADTENGVVPLPEARRRLVQLDSELDQQAHEAATSPTNERTEPTPGQQDAGNYKMGHMRVGPFDVSVENPQGSIRKSKPDAPVQWESTMGDHYGYFKSVPARSPDKEHVDTFVKPGTPRNWDGEVYRVDQNHEDGKFDEAKVMVGYASRPEAVQAYLRNYQKGWESRVRGVTAMPAKQLKADLDTTLMFARAHPSATPITQQEISHGNAQPVPPADQTDAGQTLAPEARADETGNGGTPTAPADDVQPPADKGPAEEVTPPSDAAVTPPDSAQPDDRVPRDPNLTTDTKNQTQESESKAPSDTTTTAPKTLMDVVRDVAAATGRTAAKVKAEYLANVKEHGEPAARATLEALLKPTETTADDTAVTDDRTDEAPKTDEPVVDKVEPVAEPTPPAEPAYGDSNKIFTKSAADEARALLKKKLGQLNAGIDPEAMQAGITLAGYHIEAGARSFADYSAKMISDLGDSIKPFLKSFYVAVKAWPGFDAKGMDDDIKADERVEPTITKEPEVKKDKLQDAGEKMAGKRADEIAKDLKNSATGNAKKDLGKILDRASKSAVWPIKLAEAATPGTRVYLERVRDAMLGFVEYAGAKVGGGRGKWSTSFSDSLLKFVERGTTQRAEIEREAAEYISVLEALRDATSDAMTVEQARAAIERLVVDKTMTLAEAKEQGINLQDADVLHSSDGSATFHNETGKKLSNYLRRTLGKIYSLKYGLANEIKDDDERTRAKPMVRPKLENIVRVDMKDHRDGKDMTGQDFIDTFGFRGVEFGNWVNGAERQINVNLAFDSFHDLADTLGIKPKDISLGGKLGLAFGSRGHGKASAHYEPDNVVINLTKTRGDGTVAHEWGHAFDYALRAGKSGPPSDTSTLAVNDLKKALKQTINIQQALDTVDRLLSGRTSVRGHAKAGPLQMARQYIENHYWTHASWGVVKPTDYKTEADKLGKAYWGNDEELWARSFEAFVYDEMAGDSPYLVTDWVADSTVTKDGGYKGRPYPTAEERGQFANFYRHFLESVEWTDAGPVVKEGYNGVIDGQYKELRDQLDALLPTLEARLAKFKTGTQQADGLWWYRYPNDSKRNAGAQPKGYFAFDDSARAVGYPAALDPEDIVAFGLTAINGTYTPSESAIYLKQEAKDGATDEVRADGEDALGDPSAEDGGSPEEDGGVSGGSGKRPDTGGTTDGAGSEPAGQRPGERPGDGTGAIRPPAVGGGTTNTASGQDAVQPTGHNYRITAEDHVGEGSIEKKFAENIAAIKTLKAIEAENRLATPAEQKVLVKYVGWGGMPQAFGYDNAEGWKSRRKELGELLTEDEYTAARASTTNAHYTAPAVVTAMWDAVRHFGFMGGRVNEPAVGSGNFFGLMPEDLMQASKLTGIELDPLTARIAKQLYQRANIINKGYETVTMPAGFFDLHISNVPFSNDDKPVDKKYNAERLNLHDYYFRKSIELTRPGGLVVFITSKGTLDKLDSKARKLMAEKADFIGAIRLPQDAFHANANTTVTTDIIFMRRKVEGLTYEYPRSWIETKVMDLPDGNGNTYPMGINEYYQHAIGAEGLLGRLIARRGRYGYEPEVALESDGRDLAKAIAGAIAELPGNVMVEQSRAEELEQQAMMIPAEGDAKDGGYTIKDGKLFQREGDMMMPIAEKTAPEQKRGAIVRESLKVRDAIRTLLRSRVAEQADDIIKANKVTIDKAYKAFVKKFGFLNDVKNIEAFAADPDAALLLAIEKWDPDKAKGTRVEIDFERRKPIEHTDNVKDALTVSLNEKGRVDWDTITRLTGMSEALAKAELKGLVYDDPEQGWVTSEEYLSGNVRDKLMIARTAAEADESFNDNVKALEGALPDDLPPSKIRAMPGAPWIPGDDVAQFMAEKLNASASRISVSFIPEIGKWVISAKGNSYKQNEAEEKRIYQRLNSGTEALLTWGTRAVPFLELMDYALNGGFPTVYYPPDKDGKREINRKATAEANAKLVEIKENFQRWVWEDDARATRLGRKYNDEMNGVRLRTYAYPAAPGQIDEKGNIRLSGMAVGMSLRPHQGAGVWRTVISGNTYYAHEVGTGKTFTITAAAMEQKRLGIAKKPMIAVLNSTIDQFKAEFLRLYPGANILAMNISQSKLERKRQLARIALNDWDAVIVTHESFSKIPMSEATIRANFQREIDNLADAILASKADKMSTRVVKELEKSKKALENRMKIMLAKREKDDLLSFEELGVDSIFVDEAQEFKNLMFATRMGRQIRGLNPEGSGRAFDLFMKTNWLNDNLGRGVTLATGTPISNSVGELFTISRYLQPSELRKRGIQMFDPWANSFGDIGQVTEYLPEGGGYQKVTKFNRFVNIPELMQMVYTVMDTVSAEKAGIERPSLKGGKQEAVLVKQNAGVTAFMELIKERAKRIRSLGRAAQPDNMLVIVSDGRKAAMDMRLVDPKSPDYDDTKTNVAVGKIMEIYKAETAQRGTQLVFADLGVPGEGFNVYDDLKAKLVKRGIPADEIAFIHDAKDGQQRRTMFAKVNSGKIRVFVGSTKKAGTGVNVQERVAAIHNLDTHWNLANLLQRLGRGQRQGNIYKELAVFNYATAKTVDTFMWDKVQSKGRFVDQIMSGDITLREAEDISQDTMSAAEMVAVASDDPLTKEKVDLESEVQQLSLQQAAFEDTLVAVRGALARTPIRTEANNKSIRAYEDSSAAVDRIDTITVNDKEYKLDDEKTREELHNAVTKAAENNRVRVKSEYEAADALKTKARVKEARDKVKNRVLLGYVTGENVKFPLYVYAGFSDWVEITTDSGTKEWSPDAPPHRGLASVKRELDKSAEQARADNKAMAEELPKLEVEAKKKFSKHDALDAKRKRLDEVNAILTNRDAAHADDAKDDEGDKFRFTASSNGVATAVRTFEDVTFDELPGQEFFLREMGPGGQWKLTHTTSGLSVTTQASREETLKGFRDIIEARGVAEIETKLNAAAVLTDEQKQAALASDEPSYSRTAAAGAGIGVDRINAVLQPILAKWENAPKVSVLASIADAPQAVQDLDAAMRERGAAASEAVFYQGTVYLFGDQIASEARAVTAVFHEALGHAGLRGTFGDALIGILRNVSQARAEEVTRKAVEYGWDPKDETSRLRAAEEVLSEMAQTRPDLGFVQRVIAAIRAFLRKIGVKMELTDNDIIAGYILPARRFVEGGSGVTGPIAPEAEPAFAREAGAQTDTPEFRKWFGDSKVVGWDDKPLVVYHGTAVRGTSGPDGNGRFSVFDKALRGRVTEASDAKLGFWFAENYERARQAASDAKDVSDGEMTSVDVYKVYLKIENPYVATESLYETLADPAATAKIIRKAKRAGHDGVIFEAGEGGANYVVFEPEQIKSAENNRGTFDMNNPDIMFSRAALTRSYGLVSSMLQSPGKLGPLNGIATQYHKALMLDKKGMPQFKAVFDETQDYLNDITSIAVTAEQQAPGIFRELRGLSLKSMKDYFKGAATDADIAATQPALHIGTLFGGGNPLEGRKWSDEELRFGGAIMPAGANLDKVPTTFKEELQHTPAGELRLAGLFTPLTERQIDLYKEARATIDQSLEDQAKSIIYRQVRSQDITFEKGMSLADVQAVVQERLTDKIEALDERIGLLADRAGEDDTQNLIDKAQAQKAALQDLKTTVAQIETKARGLIRHGYTPVMRFGNRVVVAKDAEGKTQFVGFYDGNPLVPKSADVEMNKAAALLRAENPTWTVTTERKSERAWQLYAGLNLDALENFLDFLDPETKANLERDATIQEYLRNAVNSRSTLTRMVHRKGTAGFSTDMPRTLASFITSNARSAAGNYHGGAMKSLVEDIKQGDIKDEAADLVKYVLEPKEEAAKLRSFLFFHFLGGSIAAGIVNLSQTPMMCVDEQTEALTRTGWKHPRDLFVGEDILTYDIDTDTCRWGCLNDLNIFAHKGPLFTMESGQISSRTTDGHRWPVVDKISGKRYTVKNGIELPKGGGNGSKGHKRLCTTHSIPLGRSVDNLPADSKFSDAFVALIGWIASEGHLELDSRKHRPNSFGKVRAIVITQSPRTNAEKVKIIRGFLAAEGIKHGDRIEPVSGAIRFRIPAADTRRFLPCMTGNKVPTSKFLASLPERQLHIFINAMVDGDGNRRTGTPEVRFFNTDKALVDAFQMAVTLTGGSCRILGPRDNGARGTKPIYTVRVSQGRYALSASVKRAAKAHTDYDGTVWCPTVDTGFWVARRAGHVYCTGNTAPALLAHAGVAKVTKALADAARNAVRDPAAIGGEVGNALAKAELEGVTAPQMVHHLTATAANNPFSSNRQFRTFMTFWGGLFSTTEVFNRRVAFMAAFEIARADPTKGDPYEFAKNVVADTQLLYNKGNRPNLGRGALGATVLTFKTFTLGYLELLRRLPPKQQLIMLALLLLMAGAEGLPFAEDIEDLVDTLGQALGFSTNTSKWIGQTIRENLGEEFERPLLHGLGGMLPIALHTRLGFGNIIPATSYFKASEIDKSRDVAEAVGPVGSVLKALTDSLQMLARGRWDAAAVNAAPKAVKDAYNGVHMLATGEAEDTKGRLTLKDVSFGEAAGKAIGFNPQRAAIESEVKRDLMLDKNLRTVRMDEIASEWADGVVRDDPEKIAKARERLEQWNIDNPDLRIQRQSMKRSVSERVKAARMTSQQRFTKSLPKPMREGAQREFEQ